MSNFKPNPKPVQEQTPREIDEQLAHWYGELAYAQLRLQNAKARIKPVPADIAECEARVADIRAAEAPLHAEFARRGGWNRYFIVAKGHVHRERNCHTCRWNTEYGWLPELSDCDETEMVKVHGDLACAECFPQVLTHPAFIASAKLRKEREDALRAAQCPMSAQSVGKTPRTSNGRRAKCPSCNVIVPVTKYGLFRQHSPRQPKGSK